VFASWDFFKGHSRPAIGPDGSTHARGAAGEACATRYLRRQGIKILSTNYRIRGGEIDIIARERQTLVFIEVKASSSTSFEDPLAWIPQGQQDRIVRAALRYVKTHGVRMDAPMRFDVVTVDAAHKVRHIRDAFRPSDRFFV